MWYTDNPIMYNLLFSDVFEPHQRGRAFAYYTSGVLLGPALS